MKATSRRRVLISSVAMLLVAMLALGTATFAWFTNQASADASGIAVKTTRSSLLQVSKSDLVWSDNVQYNFGTTSARKDLKAVSSADGLNWYYGIAANKASYAVNGDGFNSLEGAPAEYVFDEMLNIRNIGGTACENVKITVTATFASDTGRIAIVPVTAQSRANDKPAPTAEAFKDNIYGKTANRQWSAVKGEASTAVEAGYKTKAAANGTTITVSTSMAPTTNTPNGAAQASYRILVWFEGQDTDLFDNSTQTFEVGAISFKVTGETNS